MHIFAFAVDTSIRHDKGVIAQIEQRVQSRIALDDDIAAIAAIAAVGSAEWNKFFPAKTHTPVAAAPATHPHLSLVNKHNTVPLAETPSTGEPGGGCGLDPMSKPACKA
jgi:hypothetical protein